MSTAIQNLPVKTLVKVLTHLRGGELGFDPYRDARTKTKDALLAFILSEHDNASIISAISAVSAVSAVTSTEAAVAALGDAGKGTIGDSAIPVPRASAVTDEATQLAQLLARLAGKGTVDEETVRKIVQRQFEDENSSIRAHYDRLEAAFSARTAPTVVHVTTQATGETRDMGIQHKRFADLLKMSQARTRDQHRLNIWLKGPAGSGKTTAAGKVAEALGLAFHFNGAISTEYELMGFKDAGGNYHRTAFRNAYEHGGVYLFDEVDSSMPKSVLAFNAALANGHCAFPDAMIARHKDCVIMAGANTFGDGATSDYGARAKQDKAFLDRFVLLDWPLDETLETALASNTAWVVKVQKLRDRVTIRGIKGHMISPRATFYGEALLAAGLSEETVTASVLRKALTDDQWAQVCQ